MNNKAILNALIATAVSALLSGCFTASSHNEDMRVYPAKPNVEQPKPANGKEYVLSGDFLFDFDSSKLTVKGRETLDLVAEDIIKSNATQVRIDGYTDRLGSSSYNLRLSEKRAQTTKLYLQEKGVGAFFETKGHGKANQVKACEKEQGAALKECLKPNRRVVITSNKG